MTRVGQSSTAFLNSLITLDRISATTPARTPLKAWTTNSKCMKFCRKAAISMMITKEGNTSPRVAITPPAMPAWLRPTKVAVFTAMMPGVHWPTA